MNKRRVICAGNGLAALNLAMNIDGDVEVFIIAADDFSTGNSFMAKGGIAIPLGDDDIEQHINDTIRAGDGLCDPKIVEDIITAGIRLVSDVKKLGFAFDESIGREGGHSRHRIRHVGDETGKYLTQHLLDKVKSRPNVHILAPFQLLELWVEDNVCKGVLIGDKKNNVAQWMSADAVVLATGGCGNLYRNNTNGPLTAGEGYSIAYRAGAVLSGLEFMQFHPTMLYEKNSETGFLVTEAFRGAGAILRNTEMEELMLNIHPLGSLAPRDIVSRSMYNYMQEKEVDSICLDFSSISKENVEKEFPSLYRKCLQYDFFTAKKIPVIPAAHYMCGGIKTNRYGETNIRNLYAIGEVAHTGLHGANRLASNSLLELMIISERAAQQINMSAPSTENKSIPVKGDIQDFGYRLNEMKLRLQSIMWDHFGIVRNGNDMKIASIELHSLMDELCLIRDKENINIRLKQMMNQVQTAILISQSALERKESRGCHYRLDMPSKMDHGVPNNIRIKDKDVLTEIAGFI